MGGWKGDAILGPLLLSGMAGLATCGGSLLVLAIGKPGPRFMGWLLGMAAGVMLGVTAMDLLPAAWQAGGARAVFLGSALCAVFLVPLVVLIARTSRGRDNSYLRLGYLVGMAIALHDLPEGMAIAAGFLARPELGLGLAVAIGLHNLPEGMATAAPLLLGGLTPARILTLSLLLAAFTPLGAGIGLASAFISPATIAPLLAAAGAAMLYVSVKELLPAAFHNSRWPVMLGLATGLALASVI